MTLHRSNPRAKPRWMTLLVLVMSLMVVGAGLAIAHTGLATTIPTNYTGGVQVDEHGANDVPGQVDMTQMGRDTSDASNYRIFWAWDSISAWTGSGQTGDACALFDTNDVDANINFVVCARVSNLNANPDDVRIVAAAAGKPVFLFDCTNKKNDRCTQPAPLDYAGGTVSAGQLGTLASGNLITETDPFFPPPGAPVGESWPHDSTIEVRIPNALPPATSSLVNVCSYPSAGNGGNNNPFDCIVTPGVQYGTLIVNKVLTNDNGGTTAVTGFSYKINGGTSVPFEADASNSSTVAVGNYSIVENVASGYTTTYANDKNTSADCTSLAVTAGGTTTCTITNNDNIATPSIATIMKWTLNDAMTLTGFASGGTTGASGSGVNRAIFTLYKDTATLTGCQASTQVFTEDVVVNDTNGTATTTTGYTTTVEGTYRWIVAYTGNSHNSPISSTCTSEVTTLP